MSIHSSRIGTVALVDTFADACINSAARRWPAEIGESMAFEWRAELASLRAERSLGRRRRFRGRWQAIRFAASLALSPSVEKEDRAPIGWRDRAPGVSRSFVTFLGFVGVAILATVLFSFTNNAGLPTTWMQSPAPDAAIDAAVILAMALVGSAAARTRMLTTIGRSPFVTSLLVTAPIGVAVYAVLCSDWVALLPLHKPDLAVMVATWALATAATSAIALRIARTGRRGLAWAVAIVGGLIALDLATMAGGAYPAAQLHAGYAYAPAWFPLSTAVRQAFTFGERGWPEHHFGGRYIAEWPSQILLSGLQGVVGTLMLCSTFVTTYVLRSGRAVVIPEPAISEPAISEPATAVPSPVRVVRPARLIGAVGLGAGLVTWAALAGTRLYSHGSYETAEALLQLRISAICLIVVSAVVVLAGRGPVVLPAAGIFAVLYVADGIGAHNQLRSLPIAAMLLLLGTATVAGAWWLSGRLSGGGTTQESSRRALIGVGIAGALAIPTYEGMGRIWLPNPEFHAVATLLAVVLWLVAITAAMSSRRTPMGPVATILYVAVPLVALMAFTTGIAERAFDADPYYDYVQELSGALFIQVPLALVALAATRWTRRSGITKWLLLGVGAVVLTVPLVAVLTNRDLVGDVITSYEPNWKDLSRMPVNQLVLAIGLGVLAARLATPPPAAPVGEPDRADAVHRFETGLDS